MASKAFRKLSGVVCLYKPLGYGATRLRRELLAKLCAGNHHHHLNKLLIIIKI